MDSKHDQLVSKLEELAAPKFWDDRSVMVHSVLKQARLATFYHGRRRLLEEKRRQRAEGRDFVFVRRYRGECSLPLAEAEQRAKSAEREASKLQSRINAKYQSYVDALRLLKEIAPEEWGKLGELSLEEFMRSDRRDHSKQFRTVLVQVLAIDQLRWVGPFSPSDLAKTFGCSPSTLGRRVDEGILHVKELNSKSWLVDRVDYERIAGRKK